MKPLNSILLSGKEVLPIIEGGKGVAITNGESSGAFAAAGAVGTFSGVNADSYDDDGNVIPQLYQGRTRGDRHEELVRYAIDGGIAQAQIAHEKSNGEGRIHMNFLWEMGAAERVVHGILEKTNSIIDGITCGAGMPYRLGDIAAQYNVYYYPIISSMRAFRALWKRAYSKNKDLLGGVVYEDPWKAGGHNGLSNSEDPKVAEDPYPRVAEVRKFMNDVGLNDTPVIMAGGVWYLRDWEDWLDNPEIGPIAFQYGTRPLLTKESPIPAAWKKALLTLQEGDIYLNRFSPTGFYSSAVENDFLRELIGREERQIPFAIEPENYLTEPLPVGPHQRIVYISPDDRENVDGWIQAGFDEPMRTPDSTLIFITKEKANQIKKDQTECMGCLSHCKFSSWKDHDNFSTGKKADPRSYCIQKTLQDIAHGAPVNEHLMFSGHNAFKFAEDPFYSNGFIPTVKELVDRIETGD